jgi:hypothetical protein
MSERKIDWRGQATMKAHPALFSAPMIRALIAGDKRQTRRLAWKNHRTATGKPAPSLWQKVKPGDLIWVRESFEWHSEHANFYFSADKHGCGLAMYEFMRARERLKSGPAIHMPRWASRLTLEVTAVRLELLQDISRDDSIAEGLRLESAEIEEFFRWPPPFDAGLWLSPVAAYRDLWTRLHGENSWNANPTVVALTFTVHKLNIDAFKAQRQAA